MMKRNLIKLLLVGGLVLGVFVSAEYVYYRSINTASDNSSTEYVPDAEDKAEGKSVIDVSTLVAAPSAGCTTQETCTDFIKYNGTDVTRSVPFTALYGRILEFDAANRRLQLELTKGYVNIEVGDLQYCNYRTQLGETNEYDLQRLAPEECPAIMQPGRRMMGECLDETCQILQYAILVYNDDPQE